MNGTPSPSAEGRARDRAAPDASPAGRAYRYYDLLMVAFVAVLMTSNVASAKILVLGPFTFDGGTIIFPVAYILGDVLTEVYGYARSRRAIWAGFALTAMMVGVFAIVGVLPPDETWGQQAAYDAILGVTPRIVAGSLVAYFVGSFSNSWMMARMKVLMRGRRLWARTIASTLVGEGLDTVLFVFVAFFGVYPVSLLVSITLSNYVFKVGLETLVTPVTYGVVNALKGAEGEDYYDHRTDFNPFKIGA